MSYEYSGTHRALLGDEGRIRAYEEAFAASIREGDIVLDIGTGSGVLAMMAARAGAGMVYAVEATDMISAAMEEARRNGLAERIRFIHGRLDEVEVPEKVDLITSEMMGNLLIDEDMIPLYARARRFLKDGGRIIPERVKVLAAPVEKAEVHEGPRLLEEGVAGLSFTALADLLRNDIAQIPYSTDDLLGPPRVIYELDTYSETVPVIEVETELAAERGGRLDGAAIWWEAEMAPKVFFSIGPENTKTHWSKSILPVDPVEVLPGPLSFYLKADARSRPHVWSWRISMGDYSSLRSTFNALAFLPETFSPRTGMLIEDEALEISGAMADARRILNLIDGRRNLSEIASSLFTESPGRFNDQNEAVERTRSVLAILRRLRGLKTRR